MLSAAKETWWANLAKCSAGFNLIFLFVCLQANVNPKAELAADFKERRRTVHLGSCKLMCGDLKATAEKEAAAIKVMPSFASESVSHYY